MGTRRAPLVPAVWTPDPGTASIAVALPDISACRDSTMMSMKQLCLLSQGLFPGLVIQTAAF